MAPDISAAPDHASQDQESIPFHDRFGVKTLDAVIILVVAALVAWRVVNNGSHHTEGALLGRPLRVGITSWPGYAGGLVANNGLRPSKDSDFWIKHKLLVEFVLLEDETELHRQFLRGGDNGGIDVMGLTVAALAQQYSELAKGNPKAFMQVDWSRGGDAIVASAEIKKIEDLRTKTIAVSKSASEWLFEYSLENSSLTDVEKQRIRTARTPTKSSQEARDLFVNSKVDAAALWEPDVSDARQHREGAHVLLDTSTATNLIADVMVAKEKFIQDNQVVIAAFLEEWLLEGTRKATADPMLAVKVLEDEPTFARLGEETTHKLLTKAALATLADNSEMFGLSGGEVVFDQLFTEATDIWIKRNYLSSRTAPESARNIGKLRELFSAHPEPFATSKACGSEIIMTRNLPVAFVQNQALLSSEGRKVLNSARLSLLLRGLSEAQFCIQAKSAGPTQPTLELRQAREESVIAYLASTYNRPRSQFVAESSADSDKSGVEKARPRIRLNVVSMN
jgi:NitT/TauT family transport system substrate-binding protein